MHCELDGVLSFEQGEQYSDNFVGFGVGCALGRADGVTVGIELGLGVGDSDGLLVGADVGDVNVNTKLFTFTPTLEKFELRG